MTVPTIDTYIDEMKRESRYRVDKILGAGLHGIAFLIQGGRVLKATDSSGEFKCVGAVYKGQLWTRSKHLPIIYDMGQFSNGFNWYVREELSDLSESDWAEINMASMVYESGWKSPEMQSLLGSIAQSTGIYLFDVHASNWGKRKTPYGWDLVIRDVDCREPNYMGRTQGRVLSAKNSVDALRKLGVNDRNIGKVLNLKARLCSGASKDACNATITNYLSGQLTMENLSSLYLYLRHLAKRSGYAQINLSAEPDARTQTVALLTMDLSDVTGSDDVDFYEEMGLTSLPPPLLEY